jgi:hypothetical protein
MIARLEGRREVAIQDEIKVGASAIPARFLARATGRHATVRDHRRWYDG